MRPADAAYDLAEKADDVLGPTVRSDRPPVDLGVGDKRRGSWQVRAEKWSHILYHYGLHFSQNFLESAQGEAAIRR